MREDALRTSVMVAGHCRRWATPAVNFPIDVVVGSVGSSFLGKTGGGGGSAMEIGLKVGGISVTLKETTFKTSAMQGIGGGRG